MLNTHVCHLSQNILHTKIIHQHQFSLLDIANYYHSYFCFILNKSQWRGTKVAKIEVGHSPGSLTNVKLLLAFENLVTQYSDFEPLTLTLINVIL